MNIIKWIAPAAVGAAVMVASTGTANAVAVTAADCLAGGGMLQHNYELPNTCIGGVHDGAAVWT